MSKYTDVLNNYYDEEDISLYDDEYIAFECKPKKSAFVLNSCLTLAPFALIWLFFDLSFIFATWKEMSAIWFFIIPFFAVHLMPVWLWIGSMINSSKNWNKTVYYVTNRRVILLYGFQAIKYIEVFYSDVESVEIKRSGMDKTFNVGDIHLKIDDDKKIIIESILDIENYEEVYNKIKSFKKEVKEKKGEKEVLPKE